MTGFISLANFQLLRSGFLPVFKNALNNNINYIIVIIR